MVPDLTLEVIYLNQSTDFKMEFDICGCANIRFLSHLTHSKASFLSTLGKSVVRSRVIVAVGSFNPLDSEYLPTIISKATGYIQKAVDKTALGITSDLEYSLPENSIPLILENGLLCGCVLESNDQSIIMLTADRELRHKTVSLLICPYLKMVANKIRGGLLDSTDETPEAEALEPIEKETVSQAFLKEASDDALKEKLSAPALDNENEAEEESKRTEKDKTDEQDEISESFVVLEQPENSAERYDLKDLLKAPVEAPKNPRRLLKAVISVLLVLAVLLSAYFGYEFVYQPMHYSAVLSETVELYGQSWSGLPSNMLFKFGKLYKINKDIIGWLSVPSTSINLPVVSSAGRTDNFYKTHLFEGSVSKFGTPFTYSNIGKDTFCRNTVIYGKGEGEGSAFSEIKEFLSQEKYRAAPVLTFDSVYMEQRFKILSVFETERSRQTEYAQTSFFDDTAFLSFANTVAGKSVIKTNIDVKSTDELLTLVCEDKNKSVILVARKVRDGEKPLVDFEAAPEADTPPLSSVATQSGSSLTESENSLSSDSLLNTSSKNTTTSKESILTQAPVNSKTDMGESRVEQDAPPSSTTEVKPTTSSKKSSTSSKNSTSKKPVSSNKTSSADSSSKTSSKDTESEEKVPEEELPKLPIFKIKNSLSGETAELPANEAVAQIIEAEMGSHFHEEALKAQAVATYSWLLASGAASGSVPSAPMKTAGARAVNAANSVAGVVALYDGKVALTSYFPISAGKTADSGSVWPAQLAYLKSVDSSVDKNADKFQTIKTYSATELAEMVKESTGIDLTKISDKSTWFNCTYDSSGVYVKTLKIGGKSYKGTFLRTDVLNYDIRSSAYTISYSKYDDKFKIVVKGYGHGVGMSQVGANYYAQSGLTYEQILKHYYTGIELGLYTAEK